MSTTKQLAKTDAPPLVSTEQMVAELETLSREYGPQALAPLSSIARSMKLSEGIRLSRELVKKALPHIRHLAGSQLGFRTDKDTTGGYADPVLAECLTEACLRGVSWTGNEFNVIAGRCYITKEGYTRLVGEIDGLTDLNPQPGVPEMDKGTMVVPFHATWKLHGNPMSLTRRIPIRVTGGTTVDNAIGKATRKMLASIFFLCTGSNQSGSDAELDAFVDAAFTGGELERAEATTVDTGKTTVPPPAPTVPGNKEAAAELAALLRQCTNQAELATVKETLTPDLFRAKGLAPNQVKWVEGVYAQLYASLPAATESSDGHGEAWEEPAGVRETAGV